MSSIPAAVAPPPPQQVSAFDGLAGPLQSNVLDPSRLAQSLAAELARFTTGETELRNSIGEAAKAPAAATSSESRAVGFEDIQREASETEQRSLRVIMQTYDFALDATLVTNAATTFTSSVNTLIKTQ
jgi:hypothetical protein